MIVYLDETIILLFSRGEKETVDKLVKSGEVKIIEKEGQQPIKYLKITE
jgi:hypothetical protein